MPPRRGTRKAPRDATHIYFDWSGTLAHKGTREIFIAGDLRVKHATLLPDALETLKALYEAGYKIGLISNTSNPPAAFRKALRDAGLLKYIRGAIITNRPGLCRKPCAAIFEEALTQDGVRPEQAIMVGDKHAKDIVGARRVGMRGVHVPLSARRTRRNPMRRLVRELTQQ